MGRRSRNAGKKKRSTRGAPDRLVNSGDRARSGQSGDGAKSGVADARATCDLFGCDGAMKLRCGNCDHTLCATCCCGSLKARDKGTTVVIKCPFCRSFMELEPAFEPFAGDSTFKGILAEGTKSGELVEVPAFCGDCDCQHSVPVVLKTHPCSHGCYGCDGSAIQVFR